MKQNKLFEASEDLQVYKKLLRTIGDYCKSTPATGVDKMFDDMVGAGKKVIPVDKNARAIIKYILKIDSAPAAVQKLLNMRFSDLPVGLRPLCKKGRRHEVAFWGCGGRVSDRVKDLLQFAGGAGKWVDTDGNKVELIDMTEEK